MLDVMYRTCMHWYIQAAGNENKPYKYEWTVIGAISRIMYCTPFQRRHNTLSVTYKASRTEIISDILRAAFNFKRWFFLWRPTCKLSLGSVTWDFVIREKPHGLLGEISRIHTDMFITNLAWAKKCKSNFCCFRKQVAYQPVYGAKSGSFQGSYLETYPTHTLEYIPSCMIFKKLWNVVRRKVVTKADLILYRLIVLASCSRTRHVIINGWFLYMEL